MVYSSQNRDCFHMKNYSKRTEKRCSLWAILMLEFISTLLVVDQIFWIDLWQKLNTWLLKEKWLKIDCYILSPNTIRLFKLIYTTLSTKVISIICLVSTYKFFPLSMCIQFYDALNLAGWMFLLYKNVCWRLKN